jgi:hypothetical protein
MCVTPSWIDGENLSTVVRGDERELLQATTAVASSTEPVGVLEALWVVPIFYVVTLFTHHCGRKYVAVDRLRSKNVNPGIVQLRPRWLVAVVETRNKTLDVISDPALINVHLPVVPLINHHSDAEPTVVKEITRDKIGKYLCNATFHVSVFLTHWFILSQLSVSMFNTDAEPDVG